MGKIKGFFELMRLHNAFMGSLGVVIGFLLSTQLTLSTAPALITGILVYVLIAAGGNAINDYFDMEVDKVNRPYRPIPRGDVSPKETVLFSVALWVMGTLLSFLPPSPVRILVFPATFLIALLFSVMGFLYSAKLKLMGFPGNVVVGLSFAFGPLFGAMLTSTMVTPPVISCFLTSFFLLVAREIVKGMEDIKGDRLRNVRTIALVYGNSTAAIISAVFDCLAIVSFTLVMLHSALMVQLMVLAGDVIVGVAMVVTLVKRNSRIWQSRASFLLKVGALMGLLAFLIYALYRSSP